MEVNLEMQKHIKLLEFIAVACQKANALLPSSLYLYTIYLFSFTSTLVYCVNLKSC